MSKKITMGFLGIYSGFCLFSLAMVCQHHRVFRISGDLAYLGGPSADGSSPVEMMWWLAIFVPVWLSCGFILDRLFGYAKMRIYRSKSFSFWWLTVIVKIAALNILYFAGFGVILCSNHMINEKLLNALILMVSHSLFMTSMMVWIFFAAGNIIVSVCSVLILEVISTILVTAGMKPFFNPFVWGMYNYSEAVYGSDGYGIIAAVVIQVLFFIVSFCVPSIFKKILMRGINCC